MTAPKHKVDCPECSGTGAGTKEECHVCNGFGEIWVQGKPEPPRTDWPGETSA